MIKPFIYASAALAGIWIILCETAAVATAVTGVVVGVGCMYVFYRLLPVSGKLDINYFRLAVYPLYLILHIYISGFEAVKILFSDADVRIVKVRTRLANGFLRVVLANSITLTPGTVSLDLIGDEITVLWLADKSQVLQDGNSTDEQIKGKMERILLKAQK